MVYFSKDRATVFARNLVYDDDKVLPLNNIGLKAVLVIHSTVLSLVLLPERAIVSWSISPISLQATQYATILAMHFTAIMQRMFYAPFIFHHCTSKSV